MEKDILSGSLEEKLIWLKLKTSRFSLFSRHNQWNLETEYRGVGFVGIDFVVRLAVDTVIKNIISYDRNN